MMQNTTLYPFVHARTDKMDFRTGKLLFAPTFFQSNTDLKKNVLEVANKTVGELSKRSYIRSIFSDGSVCVIGVTATIPELSKQCGREVNFSYVDTARHQRVAYTYIGVAFHVCDRPDVFELSAEVAAELYEKYIALRWNEHGGEPDAYETRYIDDSFSSEKMPRPKEDDAFDLAFKEAMSGKPTLYIEGMIVRQQEAEVKTTETDIYNIKSNEPQRKEERKKEGTNQQLINMLNHANKQFEQETSHNKKRSNSSIGKKIVLVGTLVIAGIIFLIYAIQ